MTGLVTLVAMTSTATQIPYHLVKLLTIRLEIGTSGWNLKVPIVQMVWYQYISSANGHQVTSTVSGMIGSRMTSIHTLLKLRNNFICNRMKKYAHDFAMICFVVVIL